MRNSRNSPFALRTFTMDDASLLCQLNSDTEVIRYTDDPIRGKNEAIKVFKQLILPGYSLYNHRRWAVHIKDTMEFICCCALKYRSEKNETDLGNRFMKLYWQKGFSTEATNECMQYEFEIVHCQTIDGKTVTENTASLNVLQESGMN